MGCAASSEAGIPLAPGPMLEAEQTLSEQQAAHLQLPAGPDAAAARQLLSDKAHPSAPVASRGISLAFLSLFVDAIGRHHTVTQLLDTVRDLSAASHTCLWDFVPREHVGQPTFFISHTWSQKLGDTVAALEQRFTARQQPAESTIVWLDIFAINQHPYTEAQGLLEDDVANLGSVLKATERTLLSVGEAGVALKRIWCLFEVWQTVRLKGVGSLEVLLHGVSDSSDMFSGLHVGKARATFEEDRTRILKQIREDYGGDEMALNLQIKQAVVASACDDATEMWDTVQAAGNEPCLTPAYDPAFAAELFNTASAVLMAAGSAHQAEVWARRAVDMHVQKQMQAAMSGDSSGKKQGGRASIGGPPTGGASRASIGGVPANGVGRPSLGGPPSGGTGRASIGAPPSGVLGRSSIGGPPAGMHSRSSIGGPPAGDMSRQSMGGPPSGASGRVSIGGPPASAFAGDDYPIALANLGQCLKSQGKHTEAEQLFSRALELRSEVALLASRTGLPEPPHNERHRLTLGALLANCLKAQGRYAEAQPLLRHVVGWWQKQGGGEEARVATAQAMDSLGTCLSALGDPSARSLLQQALDARLELLGKEHPDSLTSMNNVAGYKLEGGQVEEAEAMFTQLMEVSMRVQGPEHPHTLQAQANLGACYMYQNRLREAEEVLVAALEGNKRTLGRLHPDTLDAASNLAACLKFQGRSQDAMGYAEEVLRGREQVLGLNHPDTKVSQRMYEELSQKMRGPY